MKRSLLCAVLALFAIPSFAQTVANGPYYALPAWDQQIPAIQRFIALLNWGNGQAVLDRETGLVWESSPRSDVLNWATARGACATRSTGGRRAWRLPSLPELSSLMDPAAVSPSLPTGHPFTNVNVTFGVFYWTATTEATDVSRVWVVSFFNAGLSGPLPGGAVGTSGKNGSGFVWCVRGPMNADAY